MSEPIVFPDVPPARWDPGRDGVSFPAVCGEKTFDCLASRNLLVERFEALGPSPEEALRTYEKNRTRLQRVARSLILGDQVGPNNEVHLNRDSFGLRQIIFSEAVRESPDYRLARLVTAELEDVLGPAAGRVTVEWDRIEDTEGHHLYLLDVRDPLVRARYALAPNQFEHPRDLRGRLYRLWGDLLQERSHRQLQEIVGAGPPEG